MNSSLDNTRLSLLMSLRDKSDIVAWDQFVAIYQPLIYRIAKSKGFQDSDACDIVQEVLLAISKSIHRWDSDPQKGRFRDWLFRVSRNMAINFLTRRKHQSIHGPVCISDMTEWIEETHDRQSSDEFDVEFRRELYLQASQIVRSQIQPHTWSAFELTSLKSIPIAEAANQLGMKEGSVLVARCRVLAKLRDTVQHLEFGTIPNLSDKAPHHDA